MLVINRIGQGKIKRIILKEREVVVVMVDNTEHVYKRNETKGGNK